MGRGRNKGMMRKAMRSNPELQAMISAIPVDKRAEILRCAQNLKSKSKSGDAQDMLNNNPDFIKTIAEAFAEGENNALRGNEEGDGHSEIPISTTAATATNNLPSFVTPAMKDQVEKYLMTTLEAKAKAQAATTPIITAIASGGEEQKADFTSQLSSSSSSASHCPF